MSKKTKVNIIFAIFLLILSILLFMFIPTFFNKLLLPMLGNTERVVEGLAIGNWLIIPMQWIAAIIFFYIAFLIVCIVSINGNEWKKNKGNEYGSARLMTDEELDELLPKCLFNKDEQDRPGDPKEVSIESNDDSRLVVFDYFEYEVANDGEN